MVSTPLATETAFGGKWESASVGQGREGHLLRWRDEPLTSSDHCNEPTPTPAGTARSAEQRLIHTASPPKTRKDKRQPPVHVSAIKAHRFVLDRFVAVTAPRFTIPPVLSRWSIYQEEGDERR